MFKFEGENIVSGPEQSTDHCLVYSMCVCVIYSDILCVCITLCVFITIT